MSDPYYQGIIYVLIIFYDLSNKICITKIIFVILCYKNLIKQTTIMPNNEKLTEILEILERVSYVSEEISNTYIVNSISEVKHLTKSALEGSKKSYEDIYSHYYSENRDSDGSFKTSFVDFLTKNYNTPIKK